MNELSYSISLINCVDNLNELLRIGYELIYENNSKAENASCNHKIQAHIVAFLRDYFSEFRPVKTSDASSKSAACCSNETWNRIIRQNRIRRGRNRMERETWQADIGVGLVTEK